MCIALLVTSIIISCDKSDLPNPSIPSVIIKDSSIVWQFSRQDSQQFFSMKPILNNQSVYFSFTKSDETNYPNKILSFNKLNGSIIWSWGEIGSFNTLGTTVSNDGCFISCHHRNYSFIINANTGQTNWRDYSARKAPKGNIVGDFFYTSVSSVTNDTMYLIRSSLKYLKWDTLFSVSLLENNQNFRPLLDQPKLWMNPSGDSILIVPDRMVRKGGSAYRFDIYAFNINMELFKTSKKLTRSLQSFTASLLFSS